MGDGDRLTVLQECEVLYEDVEGYYIDDISIRASWAGAGKLGKISGGIGMSKREGEKCGLNAWDPHVAIPPLVYFFPFPHCTRMTATAKFPIRMSPRRRLQIESQCRSMRSLDSVNPAR